MKLLIWIGMVLGLLVCVQLPASATETWPVKDFRVFMEDPNNGKAYPSAVSSSVKSEIERWLKRVAQEYEKMGFNPPHYDHVTDISDIRQAFKVYVYPFDGEEPAAMAKPCVSIGRDFAGIEYARNWEYDETYMIVESRKNVQSGNLTDDAYKDLAHELFHAVQNTYPLFSGDCNSQPGYWITEGMAEAVAVEMARKLYPKKKFKLCQVGGMRQYNLGLYVKDKKPQTGPPCPTRRDYMTLSFWQFLGEYAHRRFMGPSAKRGYLATEEFVPPDYRFLHNFFSQTQEMGTSRKEYAWLDTVLKQNKGDGKHQFGITLHTAYSRFAGTFASYWKYDRRKLYRIQMPLQSTNEPGPNSNLDREPKWMEWIFGTCFEVSVTKDATPQPVKLPMRRVASRCLKVNFNFTGRVGLTFYASGLSNPTELEALAISTNGGKKIIRRHPAEQVPDKVGAFPNISAKAGVAQYFIVSNVAEKASSTVMIDPLISIVPEIGTTDMAKEEKDPDDPDPSEKEERKNARQSRSWTGAAWQEDKRPCRRPFEADPCGGTTRLHLQLVSDTAHLLGSLAEPSMSWERKFRLFEDVAEGGGDSFMSDFLNDTYEIQQQDGWEVKIVVPQIQPGFTGTISNAHIQVAKGVPQRGSYKALGPWVGSCQRGYRSATGKVMIEEFSKYVLKGTFSAQLVDSEMLKPCQTPPTVQSDGGSFSITKIAGHLNIDVVPPSDEAIIDRTIEDANEVLPGLITDDMREHIKEKARQEREEQRQDNREQPPSEDSRGSMPCDCQCHLEKTYCEANPNSSCCQFCDPIFKLCKGQSPTNQSALSPAAEAQEVQSMRQRFEAHVDSIAPSPAIKQQMMKAFDDLKTIDEKKLFMLSIPQSK